MGQWNNSKNSEIFVLLSQISSQFQDLVKIYADEEKKKLERLIALQKTYIKDGS